MSEAEVVQTTKEGFEILCMWARNIAMLPLEDWDRAFERDETLLPITDPTLYRAYLYSEKAKVIRKIIQAAIPLKKLVLELQPLVRVEIERKAHERSSDQT